MDNLTRDQLERMPGAVVIVRWRHCLGFGKEHVLRTGYGLVRTTGDVYASDRRSTIGLRLEELGKTWEARLLTDAPPEWEEP